jgi:hypothetical protein
MKQFARQGHHLMGQSKLLSKGSPLNKSTRNRGGQQQAGLSKFRFFGCSFTQWALKAARFFPQKSNSYRNERGFRESEVFTVPPNSDCKRRQRHAWHSGAV